MMKWALTMVLIPKVWRVYARKCGKGITNDELAERMKNAWVSYYIVGGERKSLSSLFKKSGVITFGD
jgi:hypothetical protein